MPFSRFQRLKVAMLRKSVEKRLQSQGAAMSGKQRCDGVAEFQVVCRLKGYGCSPEIGLWIHGMYPVAIEHEIGAQAKISIAPDPPEKAGYVHGAEPTKQAGQLQRAYALDSQHGQGFRVVGQQQTCASVGSPP